MRGGPGYPVVDVDPGLRWPVFGVHGDPVTPVAHRDALGAVEVERSWSDNSQMTPCTCVPSNGSTVATPRSLISQSWSANRPAGIDGAGATLSHLSHAQVGPVREVKVAGPHSARDGRIDRHGYHHPTAMLRGSVRCSRRWSDRGGRKGRRCGSGHCDVAQAVGPRDVRKLPGVPDCLESREGRADPAALAAGKRAGVRVSCAVVVPFTSSSRAALRRSSAVSTCSGCGTRISSQ